MTISISLAWERCEDGYKLKRLSAAEQPWWWEPKKIVADCLVPCSDRRESVELSISDVSEGCALNYLRARTTKAKIAFFDKFGPVISVPTHVPEARVMIQSVDEAEAYRQTLETLLSFRDDSGELRCKAFNAGAEIPLAARARMTAILRPAGSGPPRFTLAASSLWDFMYVEAGLMLSQDKRVTTCEHCGDFFAVGAANGRRKGAIYCSPKCKTAAWRARASSN